MSTYWTKKRFCFYWKTTYKFSIIIYKSKSEISYVSSSSLLYRVNLFQFKMSDKKPISEKIKDKVGNVKEKITGNIHDNNQQIFVEPGPTGGRSRGSGKCEQLPHGEPCIVVDGKITHPDK